MPCRLAISSMSLGRCFAGHNLVHKLDMAQKYGYEGLELFHEDLVDVAETQFGGTDTEHQLSAAGYIRHLCAERGITILCLQPFMHYEGLLDAGEHAARLEKLRVWFQLVKVLETDMIQIPSSFLPAEETTGDVDVIVKDLVEVAEMGLQERPAVRFVYESLAWGTHVNRWEQCWEMVRRVDKPNFGICLDSFNIAGRIYADPASPSGVTEDGEEVVHASMAHLVHTVDVSKVFYVQVVDAERLSEPLCPGHAFHVAEQPARMSWSRNCRLFYGEQDQGAYLPVKEISRAFFQGLKFEGWVSLELFNRRMADTDPGVPEELAKRGAVSWAKLIKDMGLKVGGPAVVAEIRPSL